MSNLLTDLSNVVSTAVDRAAAAVVQVSGHRRPAAGVVFGENLVVAPARVLGDDVAVVRLPDGKTAEGQVLGHAIGMGLGVVKVPQLGITPITAAPEPKVGALAIAVGRTWSGSVMASITNVAVVGGPLRTGRTSEIARVIRIAQPPHGALTGGALVNGDGDIFGIVTLSAIRGTTVVIPVTLAWDAAHHIVKHGGARQGYLGISTLTVALPSHQRGASEERGLLITSVAPNSPAQAAGLYVGDVLVRFDGAALEEPETLVTLLRGDRIGKPVTLSVMRADTRRDVTATAGERPSRRG
jgi:S1-C subfamily serine protease